MTLNTAVGASDLSSKARLRLSALALFAEQGVDRSSIRLIARRAGVAPGLVRHHYGNKAGLVRAVDDSVIELVERRLSSIPLQGTLLEISESRDRAFAQLLAETPLVAAYMRQALIRPLDSDQYELLDKLVDLALDQTRHLQALGIEPRGGISRSTYATVVRQIRRLVMDPVTLSIAKRLSLDAEFDGRDMPGV